MPERQAAKGLGPGPVARPLPPVRPPTGPASADQTGSFALAPAPPDAATFRPVATRTSARATPHPLVDATYWACADLFTLASQLGLGSVQPTESTLRNHVDQLLRAMHGRARVGGVPDEDVHDTQYALVALLDEILVQTNWPGRLDWYRSPLQLVYFRDNTAGENFFRRTATLLGQPHRAHVLLVYYYCLALGFRGRYAGSESAALVQVYDTIGATLDPHLEPADPVSPHGEPPDGEGRRALRQQAPVVRISLAFAALAVVLFTVLRVSISIHASHAVARMHSYASASGRR